MSVRLKLQNFDTLYHRLQTQKILINEVDIFNHETKEILDNIILMNYSEDNISIIPSCKCGDLRGEYYVGDLCHKCGTTVINEIDDGLAFLVWVQAPQKVERFISPMVLTLLLERYTITKPKVRLVEYIMKPQMKVELRQSSTNADKLVKLDYMLAQHGIQRGYNSFVQNFFTIVEILESEFNPNAKYDKSDFVGFLRENSEQLFSHFMPFPNRVIFSTETNEHGRYYDKAITGPINVIRRLTGIDLHTRTTQDKQKRVASSMVEMAEFYSQYLKKAIFSKYGLVRQQLVSARSHFTARAVIVSIAGPHKHDELHLCWSVACSLFRPFIINALKRSGMPSRDSAAFLDYHNRIYHPLIDEILRELIAVSGGGIAALFSRNPSMHRGSIQTVRITRVKTDPNDVTFGMSDRIAPSYNADHDGRLHHCRL